jgi:hypothetical protein
MYIHIEMITDDLKYITLIYKKVNISEKGFFKKRKITLSYRLMIMLFITIVLFTAHIAIF